MTREAKCHCGRLTLLCSGEPVKVSLCHCLDCQKRTGSLFSVAAFFARDRTAEISGTSELYRRNSASGFSVTFHFCPHCGSTVWWEPERMPHLAGVAVGAFADPSFSMPEQAVWAAEAHPWLELPESVVSHVANPPLRKPD